MELREKIKFCKICENRKMDLQTGIVCGLTNEKPTFEEKCPDFALDREQAERQVEIERNAEAADTDSGYFATEKKGVEKGVLGGIAMIAIAVVWFFVGLAADRIFFYPPVLFCFGVYALIKGLSDGNVAGRK